MRLLSDECVILRYIHVVGHSGPFLGLPTLPEWAGDFRNSSQSPARGWSGDANLPEFRCPECPKMCFILIITLLLTVQWLDLPIGNVICSLELPESQYINKNLPEFHLKELATLLACYSLC